MRAIFDPNLKDYQQGDSVKITNESFHHLKNVIRIKENDDLLVLNGKGSKAVGVVLEIGKKDLTLKLNTFENITDDRFISLVIGVPKKEAFERILKTAVELNLKNIYLYYSKFAQHKVEHTPRHEKILISALEQSNGAYLPSIKTYNPETLQDVQKILLSNRVETERDLKFSTEKEVVYFVGPEAGFSDQEEQELMKIASTVALPSNILRAPTAVAAGYGYITGRLV